MSRLYKKLSEKQIAQNVTSHQYSMMLGSVFRIDATARPGHTLQELEAVINEEVEALRAKGPTAAEVDRAGTCSSTGLQRFAACRGIRRRRRSTEPTTTTSGRPTTSPRTLPATAR